MDTRVQPYYVTEARIRGSEAPDQWVILGITAMHGSMRGGPVQRTASMLELTRNLGNC